MTIFTVGQEVEVLHMGRWERATVRVVYNRGADCMVGSYGCWYVSFGHIRLP